MDPATGELTGVIKDYVELAKDCLQGQTLEFDLKGYDTRNEQLQALHTGEIGLIFHVSQDLRLRTAGWKNDPYYCNDSQCLCGRYAKMPGCRYECLFCQTVGGPESHFCHCTGL